MPRGQRSSEKTFERLLESMTCSFFAGGGCGAVSALQGAFLTLAAINDVQLLRRRRMRRGQRSSGSIFERLLESITCSSFARGGCRAVSASKVDGDARGRDDREQSFEAETRRSGPGVESAKIFKPEIVAIVQVDDFRKQRHMPAFAHECFVRAEIHAVIDRHS
jgi:hypothetical protein